MLDERSHKQMHSRKQIFYHNNKIPTPPDGGRWKPAYTTLKNRYFNHLVGAIKKGTILPSDDPAKVYNNTPYLWSINPYKFSHFFEKAVAASSGASAGPSMSASSSDDEDGESTILSSQPSLGALQKNLSRSSLPIKQLKESGHMVSSHPANPIRSADTKHGTHQFNEKGRPVTGTPMASISSFHEAHQQMHLPGVLIPLTNGRFQFKIVPLHGMTSNNTYMYPSETDHKLWFIYYRLEKRASSMEAARKLTKGDHNIVSNGKVKYPNFKISKNSELVATTKSQINDVHGPNPKGVVNSCFYMIVEFEEAMSPKLITYDAGQGKILPKMYDIVNREATWDDDTGELVFNLQTEARYNMTLNNSEEDTEEEDYNRDDGARMPPTSEHEQFFSRFDPTYSNDRNVYNMPNIGGNRTNTPSRAGRNPRNMSNSVRAEACLDRYEMTGTITMLQDDRNSGDEGYDTSHYADFHRNSLDLSSPDSSPEQSISHVRQSRTPSSRHGRDLLLGHGSTHSNSRTPQQRERSSRPSHAQQLQRMGTTLSSCGRNLRHGSSNSHDSVSLHECTSPAGPINGHGSHSHQTAGSSIALYASGQSRGSHGHSSNSHSRSLSRTRVATSSTSSGANETPLISNTFSNGGSRSDDDSVTDLKRPPTFCTTQGDDEELLPGGEINSISSEGHTRGSSALHRSNPRSNNLPSVVSATPENLQEHNSTSGYNRMSSNATIASRKSSRRNKGIKTDRMNL